MSDASNWISGVALVVSIIAAIFSYWSASESKKSRRIQQAELLAPHFHKISEAIRRIKSGERFQPTTDTVFYAVESIGALRGLLPNDEVFQRALSHLFDAFTKEHPYGSDLFVASVGYSTKRLQSEHGEVFDTFDAKRRELLNIG